MKIEYEATFTEIDKDQVRSVLIRHNAKLIKPEFMQKRVILDLPKPEDNAWLRVRDEGDKITLTLKDVKTGKIVDQKELEIIVNDFDTTTALLERAGCKFMSYQENKRELWQLHGVDVCIDEWPFLAPYVEVEADSEGKVQSVAKQLGFDYSKAYFGSTGELYKRRYGQSLDEVRRLTFDIDNPFAP